MSGAPQPQLETGMKDFIVWDEMMVRLAKIQVAVESQIPEGISENASVTVTPPLFIFDLESAPTYGCRGPWMVVNITNDGSANLPYSVNGGATKDIVQSGETRERDFKAKGKIRSLEFYPTVATAVRLAFTR